MADRILIVEDERITAEDLRDTLVELGYVVTGVVQTGAEAVAEVERNRPDIVLMDIRIKGDMDGIEAARILRDRFDIPAVYLTAHADRETLERAKRSKPLGYIVKPFQRSELQANIEIALDGHRQAQKARQRYQHLTDVFSAVLMAIISVDHREIVVLFNPTAEDLTGWGREEALGEQVRKVFRLIDMSSGKPVDLPLERVLHHSAFAEVSDALLVHKNGDTTPVAGNIAPFRSATENTTGAVIVCEALDARPEDPFLKVTAKQQGEDGSLTFGGFHIVASSPQMKQLLVYALRVARSEVPAILIEGETGTGKDLLAQFIHHSSSRRAAPFVAVNCSAIPDALLESELFGHEPGAFTDARTLKKGLFEAAQGGTLFLDEIGDIAPHMQAKLLRAVEERSFRRLGGVQSIEVDLRVICATNRDLAAAIQDGRFRLDLYHRVSVIQIVIPPLRDRREGIIPLAEHFLRLYCSRYNINPPPISPAAAARLIHHDWPGNVRELRNVIERAVVIEETHVILSTSIRFTMERIPSEGSHELRETAADPGADTAGSLSMARAERELIVRALEQCGNNQTQAALELGVTRDVLRHRMKKYGLLNARRRSRSLEKSVRGPDTSDAT